VLVGFCGLLLILRPDAGLFRAEALVGLFAGICAALAMVTVRQLGRRREPATRVVFYFALLGTVVSAVPLLWRWHTPEPTTWLVLAGIGLLATTGQFLLTRGYALAPAARIGPLSYFAVVFSAGYGWLFWDETLQAATAAGAALVVVAGLFAARDSRPVPARAPL